MINRTILQILEVFYQLYLWFFNLFFGSVLFIFCGEVLKRGKRGNRKRKVGFSVGDNVQIVGRSPKDDTWSSAMDKTIGEFGEVITVDDDYILVEVTEKGSKGDLRRWWYLCDDLSNIKFEELDNVSVDDVMGFFE